MTLAKKGAMHIRDFFSNIFENHDMFFRSLIVTDIKDTKEN